MPRFMTSGVKLRGRRNARARLLLAVGGLSVLATAPIAAGGARTSHASLRGSDQTIRVPQDQPTIPKAVAAATPGTTILVDSGTYPGGVVVPRTKPGLTIRGVDRNTVILDGRDKQKNGIVVHADDVALLNMTAHDFLENGFYWEDVKGFKAQYLTAWNILGYGIYSEGSSAGEIDHDYVSWAADAAYYIGECNPCRSVIDSVVAVRSAVGYSGTNASGYLTIRNSTWRDNGAGILPNTYANEHDPPQHSITIERNVVSNSGRAAVPIRTPLAGFFGIGIAIAGGNQDIVSHNTVTGSDRYGIAIFPTARRIVLGPGAQLPPYWKPSGNLITNNRTIGSGKVDLVLSAGSKPDNCFSANGAVTTAPLHLQQSSCPGAASPPGDPVSAALLTAPVWQMMRAAIMTRHPPLFNRGAAPPPQPNAPTP